MFQMLNADVATDRAAWLASWRASAAREVWAHPDYVTLFAQPGERALCAVLVDDAGGMMLPLIQRPLARESWAPGFERLFDLTSPYGYGGPFAWGVVDPPEFWRRITEWARLAGAVSMFLRLSLSWNGPLPLGASVEQRRLNVVRSLRHEPDFIWMDYEHKVRKNVNTARRHGLVVEIDSRGERLSAFLDIYRRTLERRDADSRYDFPDHWFQNLVNHLPGQFVLFHVLDGDTVVASELVLVSSNTLYSYLGGTRVEAYPLRPNDLLKHEIILWGREQGKTSFVLGGGYAEGDGIFRYKRAFAPSGLIPFRTASLICIPVAYAGLVRARLDSEGAGSGSRRPARGFFPAYRAPWVEPSDPHSSPSASPAFGLVTEQHAVKPLNR
jgi:hypothetical protein